MSEVEKDSTLWLAQQLERAVNLGIDSENALRLALRLLHAAVERDNLINASIHEKVGKEPIRWGCISKDHAALIAGIAAVSYAAAKYTMDHPFVLDVPLIYEKPDIEVGRIYLSDTVGEGADGTKRYVATLVITYHRGRKPTPLWVFGERQVRTE